MFYWNKKDYDDWCVLTGLMIITTTILLFCGCPQKIDTSITAKSIDRIEDKKPVEVMPVIDSKINDKKLDRKLDKIIEDKPMRISFSKGIYVVKDKDCLWNISIKIYKNPLLWVRIYEANRNIIQDPDLIYPGQELVIP